MKLTFLGAAREVTGSRYFLEACGKRMLVDYGMEQGANVYENTPLPVAASAVDYVAALNFCHGYTGGAYAYYQSVVLADPDSKIVCVKEPYPERKKVIADFVSWGKAHESFMKDRAVDTFFRFLVETFPCK